MWERYLKDHLPTPFDIFFAGITCGAILGSALTVIALIVAGVVH